MIEMKKYFLCVLMLNSIPLFAMDYAEAFGLLAIDTEAVDMYVEKIRNTIDKKHLGISKNTCLQPLIGSYLSFRKSTNLPPKKVTAEIEAIESYITKNMNNKKEVFKKLVAKHWYVSYLIDYLIVEKLKEFSRVNGSTIDDLYHPYFIIDDITGRKEMVHKEAYRICMSENAKTINIKPLTKLEIYLDLLYSDIHFTVLSDCDEPVDTSFLNISTDGQYLKINGTNEDNNNTIVWEIETGDKLEPLLVHYKNIQWSQFSLPERSASIFVTDQTNTYSATTYSAALSTKIKCYMDSNGNIVHFDKNKPAIILYKQPTEASDLCAKAFNRSQHNLKELFALKNSESIQAIKGFPRRNLERLIEKQITWLSPEINNII